MITLYVASQVLPYTTIVFWARNGLKLNTPKISRCTTVKTVPLGESDNRNFASQAVDLPTPPYHARDCLREKSIVQHAPVQRGAINKAVDITNYVGRRGTLAATEIVQKGPIQDGMINLAYNIRQEVDVFALSERTNIPVDVFVSLGL